jgi:hypothetical protein
MPQCFFVLSHSISLTYSFESIVIINEIIVWCMQTKRNIIIIIIIKNENDVTKVLLNFFFWHQKCYDIIFISHVYYFVAKLIYMSIYGRVVIFA